MSTIQDIDPVARLCRENIRAAAENQRLRNLLLINNISPDIRQKNNFDDLDCNNHLYSGMVHDEDHCAI